MKAVDGWKVCTKCGENKIVDKFYSDRKRSDGYYPICKQCHRKMVIRWQIANREKLLIIRHKRNIRAAQGLTASHVANALGLSLSTAPPELIESKRQQLLLTRAIRASKKGMNNV